MSNETTDLINDFLNEVGLSEDQNNSADSEIFNAMLGLQTFSETMENISKLSNKSREELSGLKEKLETNIFDKIAGINVGEESQAEHEDFQVSNGVGQSFEQIILNQARAMQPAREAPANLPTNELRAEEKPKAIHNYIGSDPYREPIG